MEFTKSVFNICEGIVWLIGLSFIATTIHSAYLVIRDKYDFKEFIKLVKGEQKIFNTLGRRGSYILILLMVIGIINIGGRYIYPSTQIGSLFEKKEYEEAYYVFLYPEDSKSMNYKLKADVWAHIESLDGYDGYRTYSLLGVYLDNGKRISFDGEEVFPSERTLVVDESGRYWYVELTTEKA